MAHKLMEKKIQDEGIQNIEIYSCGIFAEDGDGSTYNAIEAMKEYDVNLKEHRATNIRNSQIKEMDLILCATKSHKNSVLQMYKELEGKVYTIKEYIKPDEKDLDIKDPWGYDIDVYRFCASEIDKCLDELIKKLK